jgi:acyl carrier protein
MTDTCRRIEAICREHSGVGADFAINNETSLLRDLQLDSLDRVELAMLLEDEFSIQIPDDDVDNSALGTFGGLVAYVQGKIDARAQKFADFKHSLPTVENARPA